MLSIAHQKATLTVTRAPAIRKIRATRARVGVALRLAIRATGYPVPVLAESGPLPGGLSFTDHGNGVAVIAGTPAVCGGVRDSAAACPVNPQVPRRRRLAEIATQGFSK